LIQGEKKGGPGVSFWAEGTIPWKGPGPDSYDLGEEKGAEKGNQRLNRCKRKLGCNEFFPKMSLEGGDPAFLCRKGGKKEKKKEGGGWARGERIVWGSQGKEKGERGRGKRKKKKGNYDSDSVVPVNGRPYFCLFKADSANGKGKKGVTGGTIGVFPKRKNWEGNSP